MVLGRMRSWVEWGSGKNEILGGMCFWSLSRQGMAPVSFLLGRTVVSVSFPVSAQKLFFLILSSLQDSSG